MKRLPTSRLVRTLGRAWRAAEHEASGAPPPLGTMVLVAAVAVVLVCSATEGAAGTASGNRPAITFVSPSPGEGATLTTDSVQFAFTYNRKPKQTRSLICGLSGPTSSSGACDAPTAIAGDGSRSGTSYA